MRTQPSEPPVRWVDSAPLLQLPECEGLSNFRSPEHQALLDVTSCASFSDVGVHWQPGRWRYHQDYELHTVVSPFRRAFIGDEVHRLVPGNVVLIGPFLPHNFEFSGARGERRATPGSVLRFSDAPFRRSMDLLPDLREAEPLLNRARQGIEFVGFRDRAVERLDQIKDSRGLERFSAFAALLCELAHWQDFRVLTAERFKGPRTTNGAPSGRICTVLDYLRINYMQEFSLPEISAMVGMHETALSRQFRKVTGSTFTDFVTELRIAKACQLLLHTERPISSVCYEVGFNNVSNFNRHFLKRKGLTPSKYRTLAMSTAFDGAPAL